MEEFKIQGYDVTKTSDISVIREEIRSILSEETTKNRIIKLSLVFPDIGVTTLT